MSRLGLRLRLLGERAWPHTPAKRIAYGLGLLVAIAVGVRLGVMAGVALAVVVAALRLGDIRLAGERRPKLSGMRPYFFEGDGSPPDR